MTLPLTIPATPPLAPNPAAPSVLGVDLSLTRTGLATIDEAWSVETTPTSFPTPLGRLRYIARRVREAAEQCQAELVVLEGLSFGSTTGKVSERAGLHWLVRDRLDFAPFPVAIVAPKARAKYATGNGNADKAAVMRAVADRFPVLASNPDEADAIVLLAMGLDRLGYPLAAMPAGQRASLLAAQWPAAVGGSL